MTIVLKATAANKQMITDSVLSLLLARLYIVQYCFAVWRVSSSSVTLQGGAYAT